jgi:hypothetical protein
MKSLTGLAFALVISATLSAPSAHAWPWSKLDLASIQGQYNLVIEPDMPLDCPETITVVYSAVNATLDSEAFHFSNIGRGAQPGSTSVDPNHAAYTQQSVDTTVNSNSITEIQSSSMTSSDTSQFPLDPMPMDNQDPGSPGSMGLSISNDNIVTTVKYNSGDHTLTKTVEIGGEDAGEDCTFAFATTPAAN